MQRALEPVARGLARTQWQSTDSPIFGFVLARRARMPPAPGETVAVGLGHAGPDDNSREFAAKPDHLQCNSRALRLTEHVPGLSTLPCSPAQPQARLQLVIIVEQACRLLQDQTLANVVLGKSIHSKSIQQPEIEAARLSSSR